MNGDSDPLHFKVTGGVGKTGVQLSGAMIGSDPVIVSDLTDVGTWQKPFGLNGVSMSDVAMSVTVAPGPVISQIGLSAKAVIGSVVARYDLQCVICD